MYTGILSPVLFIATFTSRLSVSTGAQFRASTRQHEKSSYPDDMYRRLIHFVQVTDLHVSMYAHPERKDDFARFINETLLQVIKPPVVIMSGDIVDSFGPSYMSSGQNLQEWLSYARIVKDTNVTKHLEWLDIRGNHDNLNLPSIMDEKNYFKKYSVRGVQHNHSYKYVYEHGDEKVAFIGIDTCMDPGNRRPFNFFGRLTQERFDEVFRLKKETNEANYTVYFGHHPSSVIFGTKHNEFKDIFANSGPYLCGHYHTAGNLVNKMYFEHEHNALELELGDFKMNRMFRVLSIDNGLLNFVDVRMNNYPIVLVTNPKTALYHLKNYEPLERIARSTHVRVLVFSDALITEVKIQIDDGEEVFMTVVDKTPLYTAPWTASKFSQGLHWIKVTAEDDQARSNTVKFQFSLDGSKPDFDFLAKIVLSVSRTTFLTGIIVMVLGIDIPLILLRSKFCSPSGAYQKDSSSLRCRFMFQLSLLATLDRIFYPLVFFPIYVCIGPWFVGYMLDDGVSICFLWGSLSSSSFVPGGIIFFYAALMLGVFYIPFIVLLSSKVHATYTTHYNSTFTENRLLNVLRTVCLAILVGFQFLWASVFWFGFGWLAFIFGFVPTGSIIFTGILWRMATVLPRNLFNGSRDHDSCSSSYSIPVVDRMRNLVDENDDSSLMTNNEQAPGSLTGPLDAQRP